MKQLIRNTLENKHLMKIIRFCMVGAFNTGFDLVVLNFLIYLFGVKDPFIFSVYKGISFVCALISSYFLNKYFTFKSSEKHNKVFLVFIFFSLIGFVANVMISSLVYYLLSLYMGSMSVHLIATISAMVGAVVSAALNYINYSYFVFKQ